MFKNNHYLAIFGVIAVIIATGLCGWRFFMSENYRVTVYLGCEPSGEECFVNDCAVPDSGCASEDVPEEYYKAYKVLASSVMRCQAGDDNCVYEACKERVNNCETVKCDIEAGDNCSVKP